MADPRFYTRSGPFTLAELAEVGRCELPDSADPGLCFSDVGTLESADSDSLSFLDNRSYLPQLGTSQAGAVVVEHRFLAQVPEGAQALLSKTPYSSYARIAQHFYPKKALNPGCHPSAIVDPTALVDETASIGPLAVVMAGAEIGPEVEVGAQAVVGEGVTVGQGSTIGSHVSLQYCHIGRHCMVHPGARIGNRGFGFTLDPEGYIDVPQLGRVIVEDRVEIGANSTIDRGAIPDTVIGAGSRIDNLVQLGHNVRLGRGCVMVAQSGVAGSSELGDYAMVAAQAGVAGHIKIGRGAKIAGQAGAMRDVEAGATVGGTPAMPLKEYFRLVALWQRQLKKT